tara:strand:- start:2033 stop:3424 length:1392 start_codon:yes stop_codon:yes gene_type:complete
MATVTTRYITRWVTRVMTQYPLVGSASLIWCITLILQLFFQAELSQVISVNSNIELIIQFVGRVSALSIPLLFLCVLLLRRNARIVKKRLVYLFSGIILFIYMCDNLFLKNWKTEQMQINQEFFIILSILILGVTFVPCLTDSLRSFWVFNNTLFVKLLKTVTYCLLVLLGLNFILLIFDFLLQLKVEFWVYQIGFIIICCGFGPLYFLSQVPIFNKDYNNNEAFPKFYVLFSSIYLLPVSVVSIICMYVYSIGLLITKTWPPMEMQIIFVVSSSVVIFLMFQFELLSSKLKSKLVTIFLKYIYISILPLAMLFIIQLTFYLIKDGITEFWYLISIYIVWVIGVCIYFITSKKRDIRIIPISLSCLLCVLLIGPLKPYEISVNSQYSRLLKSLEKHSILDKKKIIILEKKHEISNKEKEAIKDRLFFLENHNRLIVLQRNYPYPIDRQSITMQRLLDDLGLEI